MFNKDRLKYLLLVSEVVLIAFLVVVNLKLEPEKGSKDIKTGTVKTQKIKLVTYEQPKINSPGVGFGDIMDLEIQKPVVLAAEHDLSQATAEFQQAPSKNSYTIAAFGDSMIDTMGGNLEYLKDSLESMYPGINFAYYNYGIGAENLETGIARFDNSYSYHNRSYSPITQTSPDIIIVGSYSYNPFSPYDRNKHWLKLSELVDRAKQASGNVYILVEIAPLADGFGEGPGGVNWPKDLSNNQAKIIVEQLENAIGVAKEKNVGLINVYSRSLIKGSKFGQAQYVSKHDGIHTSEAGQKLTAEVIVSTIKLP